MTAPRLAVFGIFGKTNLGNEATLAAFLNALQQRFPGAAVVCIGPRDSTVSAMHGLELIDMEPARLRHHFWPYRGVPLAGLVSSLTQLATEPGRRRRATESLRGVDALVIPGTGVLDDFGQGPLDLPHHLLRWCAAAHRGATPVYFLSVGAEPVHNRLARRFLRQAVEPAAYRSYRDVESRTNAELAGAPAAADPIFPDLAFSLPSALLPELPPIQWPPQRVGLGVMGYHGWNEAESKGERIYRDYSAKIERFISWLLEQGRTVRLLSGDTRAEQRPVRELVHRFGSRVIAEPIATYQDLLRQLPETDVVIGSRFHNVLLALLLERPAISIGYSQKNDALLRVFGLGGYCQDIDTFQVDRLQAQLEQMARTEQSPGPAIRRTNADLRRQLEAQYAAVFDQIEARIA